MLLEGVVEALADQGADLRGGRGGGSSFDRSRRAAGRHRPATHRIGGGSSATGIGELLAQGPTHENVSRSQNVAPARPCGLLPAVFPPIAQLRYAVPNPAVVACLRPCTAILCIDLYSRAAVWVTRHTGRLNSPDCSFVLQFIGANAPSFIGALVLATGFLGTASAANRQRQSIISRSLAPPSTLQNPFCEPSSTCGARLID
jgi:hypothetical protein